MVLFTCNTMYFYKNFVVFTYNSVSNYLNVSNCKDMVLLIYNLEYV